MSTITNGAVMTANNLSSGAVAAEARVEVNEHARFSMVNGEGVVLHLGTGQYYGLNGVGARIWQLLEVPCTLAGLRNALLDEYDVDPEVCLRDIEDLICELRERDLVHIIEPLDVPQS